MFLLTLFAFALLGAIRRGGALRVAACGVAAAAAALAKYSLWPMLPVVAAGCALAAGGPGWRVVRRTVAALAVASSLLALAVAARADLFERQVRLLATFQR